MKTVFYLFALVFVPFSAFADSGNYVCNDISSAFAATVASTLNSMNCDVSKPFTVSQLTSYNGDLDLQHWIVCCVQK